MRSVFVYEFITGGGCWSLGDEPPAGSLLAEGMAMRDALAQDFAAMEAIDTVHLFHDVRLPRPFLPKQNLYDVRHEDDVNAWFMEMLVEANGVLIAPEFSGQLFRLAEWWESLATGELLSPGCRVIELCSNKQHTCNHLAAHGIRVPCGIRFRERPDQIDHSLWPAVIKPIDGCGSQSVQMIESFRELAAVNLTAATAWRLERFQPGLPVSVSLLAGPRGFIALQPCTQNLSDDGRFVYRGGSTPIPAHLAARAKKLALAAAATLPPAKGYLGIDIVLGSAENGSQDVVIEINPRLTTSYLGLRQACQQNLAEAMLKWAVGEPVELTWRPDPIEFAVPNP